MTRYKARDAHEGHTPEVFAFYGRYSGELQRESSIDDQLRECREDAAAEGWSIPEALVFADQEKSGQELSTRPAFQHLIEIALGKNRPFDGIVVHDTSRLARNLTDSLTVADQLIFAGVILRFTSTGLDSRDPNFRRNFIDQSKEDEQFSRGLAEKTRRGQRGQIRKGLVGTGRNYGYRNVPIEHPTKTVEYGRPMVIGVRYEIVPEEADVVRRVFQLYVNGMGLRQIAGFLNSEGVPSTLHRTGKGKRAWRYNTLKKMLHNEKYVGRNIWSRTKVVLNPNTKRKVQRPRPKQEWEIVEVPEWRIVPQELWDARVAVSAQRYARHSAVGGQNRTPASRKYIFSGHLICGVCGGSMVIGAGVTEGVRYVCKSARADKACTNRRTILKSRLEEQLLDALSANLRSDELRQNIRAEFLKQLERAWSAKAAAEDKIPGLRRQLSERETEEQRLLDAIKMGRAPLVLVQRMHELEVEKASISEQIADALDQQLMPPSVSDVDGFLEARLKDLLTILRADEGKARTAMNQVLGKLILTPDQSPGEKVFHVTGDLRLFGVEDAMRYPSRAISDTHCMNYTSRLELKLHTAKRNRLERARTSVALSVYHAKLRASGPRFPEAALSV